MSFISPWMLFWLDSVIHKHLNFPTFSKNLLVTYKLWICSAFCSHQRVLLSLSNGATAQGGPRPPLRASSILPSLRWLLSSFYILALLHLPSAVWVSLWGTFLLAHWEELSWIDHHPGVWHVLPISVYSTCRILQYHLSLLNLQNFTISFSSHCWKSSWLVPIRHLPPSITGP
jgi:hypothetical protein